MTKTNKAMILNLNTVSREELKEAAQQEPALKSALGDIENRDIESLRTSAEVWFAFNTEVGAFYDETGF